MLTRDSLVWTLGFFAAVVGYLVTAEKPPTDWSYREWLQAASFVLAWCVGRLASSPLAGANTATAKTKLGLGGLLRLTDQD